MRTIPTSRFAARILLWVICGISLSVPSIGQDKISPRLDVVYYQVDSGMRYLLVKVRKKVEKRFESIANAEVRVQMDLPDGAREAGTVVTDAKGEAKVVLSGDMLSTMDDLDEYTFSAEISETDSLEEVSESVTVKASRLKLETDDADKTIRITLETKDDGTWQAFEGAELGLYIKRRFGRILVGDELNVTDENGVVELAFETEIPGDANGILAFEAAIEDNDELGNVYTTSSAKWGTPMVVTNGFYKRTLWATRDKTPVWLLIVPNVIIAGVWGVIIYLIILIFKMKRLSKEVK